MNLHKTTNLIGLILFWGWNILSVFLCVFLIGLAILPFVLIAAVNGQIPLSISICLLILIITPIYSIYFGIINSNRAVAFFFGVEIPIIILTLFRIFIIREMTVASGFLLLCATLAIGVFAWSLSKGESISKSWPPYIVTAVHTIVMITGLYVAILSSLYAFPMMIGFLKALVSLQWLSEFQYADGLVVLVLMLFCFGTLAFFVLPVFIAYFYPKLWKTKGETLAPVFSKTKYNLTSLATTATWLLIFTMVSHQGQAGYVSQLNTMTSAEQASEMQEPKTVRKRLLQAYLNEYRYLGMKDQSRNLIPLYKDKLGSAFLGDQAQNVQSYLLGPLLYKGKRSDSAVAGKLYSKLFDSSIQRDEQKVITKALEATYNRDDVVAGLMNIGARNVIIREQNIKIEEKNNFAVIEIEEVYENLTFERQETFYYFSLPQDAALTGIWIGRTDKREKMDAFIVAPRGAAQKVYEQQVRRNIDPALLEQVGPSQYRLRVFPIPVTKPRAQFNRRNKRRRSTRAENLMRVHMRYIIPITQDANLLPTLLEKRNIDWSGKTKRSLNGQLVVVKTAWMPIYKSVNNSRLNGVSIALADQFISVSKAPQTTDKALGKLAVLVDTSYSMHKHPQKLNMALEGLSDLQSRNLATVDFFISRANGAPMSKRLAYKPSDINPFGRLTARTMITEFNAIANSADYAAIIILTDQGFYGLNNTSQAIKLNAPLYFLHIDKASSAYDDDIMDLVYRTGGGITTSVMDLKRQMTLNTSSSRVSSERLWTVSSEPLFTKNDNSPESKALAARQMILIGSFGQAPSVKTLDKFHDLAKSYNVITPYSSMIVLVNERQKEALKNASEADDRFQREGNTGEERLTKPANLLVSGVPEPHEWLLIIICFFILLWVWRKREEWECETN